MKKRIARNTYILANTNTYRKRGQFHAMDLKPYRSEGDTGKGRIKETEGGGKDRLRKRGEAKENSNEELPTQAV